MKPSIDEMVTAIFTKGFYDEAEEECTTAKIPDICLLYIRNGRISICYGAENEDFVLRRFYMTDEGKIYLDTEPVSDIIKARDVDINEAISKYHEEHGQDLNNSICGVYKREQWLDKLNKEKMPK